MLQLLVHCIDQGASLPGATAASRPDLSHSSFAHISTSSDQNSIDAGCTHASIQRTEESLANPARTQVRLLAPPFPRFALTSSRADVYHTYLSLAALSLGGEPGLEPLDAAWNVSTKVAERIRRNMGRGQ